MEKDRPAQSQELVKCRFIIYFGIYVVRIYDFVN